MESIQLSVTGMKCGGCVSTVEKILNNSDGIENVSVNLLTESAYFEITQKHIDIESVLENLKENGFPAKIYINDFSKKINKTELEKKKKWNNQWKKLTFALLLLFFSGLGHLAEGRYININALIKKINNDLEKEVGLKNDEFYLTGILILYNNMLQSLFDSQIMSLGFVMLGITIMFLVLFQSILLAVIGIIPNLLAATFVLGLMGLLNLPLDMMTITIAAITIGIAVDNSIHYIYRFREEYINSKNYENALINSHDSIGRAIFFTGITIIFGFSILILSNFIPTILFGLFTGLAMLVALLAVLTLLPKLIISIRPFS